MHAKDVRPDLLECVGILESLARNAINGNDIGPRLTVEEQMTIAFNVNAASFLTFT